MVSFASRFLRPHSSTRAVAPAVALSAVILLACVALEWSGFQGPASYEGYTLLGALLSYFGVATLVASVALSLVQSATDKWPSYIYEPIRSESARDRLLLTILLGFVISGGGLMMIAFGLSGWPAFVVTGALAALSVVQLFGYAITRIGLFDPLHLARYYAQRTSDLSGRLTPGLDWRCRRRHAFAIAAHPARGCVNQERFWRSLDRLLGLGRWMVASEREQDANEVLAMAVASISAYSGVRRNNRRIAGAGVWSRPARLSIGDERQPDPELSLFYGFQPIGRSSPNLVERTSRYLWVERLATRWIGRYVAYLLSHGEGSGDWSGWLRLQHDFAVEAASLTREHDADSVADLGSAITGFLRALGPETALARRSRDTMMDALASFLVELADTKLAAPKLVFATVSDRLRRAWIDADRAPLPPTARAADLVARAALNWRVIGALRQAGMAEESWDFIGDLHRCARMLRELQVAPEDWASLPLNDANTLLGRLHADLGPLVDPVSVPASADATLRIIEWLERQIGHWGLYGNTESSLRACLTEQRNRLAERASNAVPIEAIGDVLHSAANLIAVDFDGTVSRNQPPPTDEPVMPQPGVVAAVDRLSQQHTVAVISARPARRLRELFDGAPGLWTIGNAGVEIWPPNSEPPALSARLAAAREQLAAFVAEIATSHPEVAIENHGWLCELKAPTEQREAFASDVRERLSHLGAPACELVVTRIRTIQLMAPGVPGKGAALDDFVTEHAISGVVMCGDDRSDWPAFAAVARLREHGVRGMNVVVLNGTPVPREIEGIVDIELDTPVDMARLLIALGDQVS